MTKIRREYDFDITRADKIFDKLFRVRKLKLLSDHKLPPLEKIDGKKVL